MQCTVHFIITLFNNLKFSQTQQGEVGVKYYLKMTNIILAIQNTTCFDPFGGHHQVLQR
jgi:hypothetical protein